MNILIDFIKEFRFTCAISDEARIHNIENRVNKFFERIHSNPLKRII